MTISTTLQIYKHKYKIDKLKG